MRDHELERTQVVAQPLEQAFAFFADPWNLEAITPPWLGFRVLEAPARLRRGSRLRYRLRLFRVPLRWQTEIAEWVPPRGFTDVQLAGPYALWVHTHRLTALAEGTEIYDNVRYRTAAAPVVRGWVERIFDHRAARLAVLLGSKE